MFDSVANKIRKNRWHGEQKRIKIMILTTAIIRATVASSKIGKVMTDTDIQVIGMKNDLTRNGRTTLTRTNIDTLASKAKFIGNLTQMLLSAKVKIALVIMVGNGVCQTTPISHCVS